MDVRSHELLELDAVRAWLAALCRSPQGSRLAIGIPVATERTEVERRQARTTEAMTLDRLGVGVAAGAAHIDDLVAAAARGSTLDPAELADVGTTARIAFEIAESVVAHREEAPALAAEARAVVGGLLRQLSDRIDGALDGHGGVRDDASEELARARRALGQAVAAAGDAMRSAATAARSHLQETFVTQRSGRPVLAVKASSRSAVPGIVHDRSATGQTIFVEPLAVVEANNHVRECEAMERLEVERVLARLSLLVADHADALRAAEEVVGSLDCVLAGAALSRQWDGCAVGIGDDVVLRGARHPLLDPATAVPIDLPLNAIRALVVSGPNAGGKTVALKTLGLMALIHQLGLRVPAREATLPVFDAVRADIGDDQSIAQSLSTFSAHVRRIREIVDAAGPGTLVLLDEVAAGTDPAEGAALARAVLEALLERGALILATSHHHELKAWASETPGAANGAVGFDAIALAPTFTVRVGEPGASHAIETAERLGLDEPIIDRSRVLLGAERGAVDALLQDAQAARRAAERERDGAIAERDEAARVRAAVEQREAELAREVTRLRGSREREREQARDDARAELAALQQELGELRRQIAAARRAETRRAADSAPDERARERDRLLGRASDAQAAAIRRLAELSRAPGPPEDLAVGERVIVADLGVAGTVLAVDGDQVEVQGPSARLRIGLERLVRDARLESEPARAVPVEMRPPIVAVAPEIDVRGRRADEACEAVRAHIDAAASVGLESVRIVHGRGTGALRQAVGQELRRHPLVSGATIAGPNEGGDGATIATLA
jgi:DNA mismatch repair protein MutS2